MLGCDMNKMRSQEKSSNGIRLRSRGRIGLNAIGGQLWDGHQWYSRFIAQDE